MPSHTEVEHDLFEAPPLPPRGASTGVAVDLSDVAQSEPPPDGDSVPPLFNRAQPAPTKNAPTPDDIDFLLGLQGSRGTTASLQSPTLADLAKRPPSEPPLPPVDVDLDDALVPTHPKLRVAPVELDAPVRSSPGKSPTAAASSVEPADATGAVPIAPNATESPRPPAKSRKRPTVLLALAALGLSGAVLASTLLSRQPAREEPGAASAAIPGANAEPTRATTASPQTSAAPTPSAPEAADFPEAAASVARTSGGVSGARNPSPTKPSSNALPAGSQAATPKPTRAEPARPAITPRPSAPRAPVGAGFDRQAAIGALATQAGQASSCRKDGDPSGTATVIITFAPSGRVTSANVNGPPFAGTPTGGCIAAAFRRAHIPEFDGDKVTVSKTVVIR